MKTKTSRPLNPEEAIKILKVFYHEVKKEIKICSSQKKGSSLLLSYIFTILGQTISKIICNKIKGNACYGGTRGNDCTTSYARRKSVTHTYGGRCCFIIILNKMSYIKNFDYLLWSEDSLTDYQLFILMQEGGME